MSTPRQRRTFPTLLITAALALLASLLSPTTVGAQDVDRSEVVGAAATTPIAAPFVGSFEVWCTMGNPAPGTLCQNHHSSPAVDFGMEPGTPINATGDGTVAEIETTCGIGDSSCRGGAGKFISILHDDGRYSRYLHLSEIFVEEGQTVAVGDVIGTAGNTGRTSAPHLHYDEQFPVGTRIPMGTLIACVDGEPVLYPDSLGLTDWNDVPFGTIIRNDGYGCLHNSLQAEPATETPPETEVPTAAEDAVIPIIASGEAVYGIAAPFIEDVETFEAEIRNGDEVLVVTVESDAFTILDAPDTPVEIRLRLDSTAPFSTPVTYDPAAVQAGPTCEGLHATSGLTGTRGPDVIIGTAGNDSIRAEQGDDIVCAGAGDDIVFGGRGADSIFGEDGDDDIRGGIGKDTIFGGGGDDALRGGNGADVLLGQAGNDFVLGGSGADDIGGGAGDDLLEGRNGDDVIKGGNGDDTLLGDRHADELIGGAGVDTFNGGDGIDECRVRPIDNTPTGCES